MIYDKQKFLTRFTAYLILKSADDKNHTLLLTGKEFYTIFQAKVLKNIKSERGLERRVTYIYNIIGIGTYVGEDTREGLYYFEQQNTNATFYNYLFYLKAASMLTYHTFHEKISFFICHLPCFLLTSPSQLEFKT